LATQANLVVTKLATQLFHFGFFDIIARKSLVLKRLFVTIQLFSVPI